MKFKKLAALLLTGMMVTSMAVPAFAKTAEGAAEAGDLQITVKEAATVDAYQILQQNQSTGEWELTDWAKTALGEKAGSALTALTTSGNSNKSAIAQYLATLKTAAEASDSTADKITASRSDAGAVVVDTNELGSYLVIVTSENYTYTNMVVPNYDSSAANGLAIGTATAKGVKDNIIESKVASDTEVAVGDVVKYTVTGEMPDFRGTTEPALTITDTMSDNVEIVIPEGKSDIQDAVTVKVDDQEVDSSNYTVTKANSGVGFTLEFKSDYLKDNADKINNKTIELTYSVKVTKYSNNNTYNNEISGSYNIDGTSKTFEGPDEDVFTAALKLTKKNADSPAETLANAEFKLSFTDNGTKKYVKQNTDGTIEYVDSADSASTFTTDENGEITINGLDPDYTYTIVETKAPQGYQLAGDATIAFKDVQNEEDANGTYTVSFTENGSNNAYTLDTTENTVVGVTVTDTRLGALPNTGGMGVAVVTVAGVGAMLAFGGSFMALRKRVQK